MSTSIARGGQPSSIQTVLERYVADRAIAGAAALVWRGGHLVRLTCVGERDLASHEPVERDTIFRIASMTKPVTAVAALRLLEAGRFRLETPISDVAPELTHLRVLRDPEGALDDTVDANRPITFLDLLTHRSGLTYGEFHAGPIGPAYADALGTQIDNDLSPDEWIARLATLPLIDQPGGGFHYGVSSDLLGFLLARLSHATVGEVFDQLIFAPLGMRDTGFTVPATARHRRAGLCGFDDAGIPVPLTVAPGGHALAERPDGMTFESAGQGLWSTLDDYLAFARLFIGDGEVDGTRLLRPETLAMMTSNQLTPHQRSQARLLGQPPFAEGHGYGMGVAVVMEPEKASPLRGRGGVGTVSWPGAYGGWWQADPTDRSILLLLTHHMVDLHQLMQGIGLGVWSAIVDFHAQATAVDE
ncbi:MAG: serine hydrolase domain-containing protein [Vicinamibacterales bacterium]